MSIDRKSIVKPVGDVIEENAPDWPTDEDEGEKDDWEKFISNQASIMSELAVLKKRRASRSVPEYARFQGTESQNKRPISPEATDLEEGEGEELDEFQKLMANIREAR